MLPAMSRDEILAEIVQRPREAYVPLPDMQIIERPGWRQMLTPSVTRGGFNEVSFARLGDDIDEVIDATIAQYRAHGCKFVWRVGPDSSPELRARLAARGLVHGVSNGMARSTEMSRIASDPSTSIEEVDASTVDIFTRTMAEGWDMDPAPLYEPNRLMLRGLGPSKVPATVAPGIHLATQAMGARSSATFHLFLARVDGEPAATAGSVVFERSVYLLGGVTLERFRGRGLYRALVANRLAHARARGVPLAISHARAETSAPILERLGFETLCRYDNYSFSP